MADLIKPEELRKATLAKEVERARQIAEADKRRDEEQKHPPGSVHEPANPAGREGSITSCPPARG